jgi:phosphate transport system substrate-binding protein
MRKRFFRHFVTIAVIAAACSCARAETIVIKGSDTLGAKLLPQLAESFAQTLAPAQRRISFEIAVEGSSTGIAAIIESSVDIGLLSRELDLRDQLAAARAGVRFERIEIARDALVVVVNEANPLDRLTRAEVRDIFSGFVHNWAALSLYTGDISVYTRGTSSGSYGAFQRLALGSRDYSEFSQKLAGNEQIASEVAGNPSAIGYVGSAYAQRSGIRALEIEGLAPQSAGYPYARPLYFLIDAERTQPDHVRAFIDFALSEAGQAIVRRAGYLPRSEGPIVGSWREERLP